MKEGWTGLAGKNQDQVPAQPSHQVNSSESLADCIQTFMIRLGQFLSFPSTKTGGSVPVSVFSISWRDQRSFRSLNQTVYQIHN